MVKIDLNRVVKGKLALLVFVISSISFLSGTVCSKTKDIEIVNKYIKKDTIKVLAIGNSFSQDALEFHLNGLAKAANVPVIIGNLSIGGASLALHWENASNEKAVYAYRKIDAEGKKLSRLNVAIAEALSDQNWDYISFQQVSQNAGMLETLEGPLPLLCDSVRKKLPGKKTKFIFHQTWAYAKNASHGGFKNYDRDQLKMYQAIVDVSKRIKDLAPIDIVIPTGTAIQNGRTSVIGDNFCRDGFHLDVNIGRYTAAAAWFEMLSGKSVIGSTFKPQALSAYEAEIAQQAAHAAAANPYKVTELINYKENRELK